MEASVKSTSNRLWQFPLAAKAALRRSTKFHTVYLSRQKAAWGIKMKKENMTIKEMWHYIIFQTKGYWTIKVALILGAIMTASVPYINNIFYAKILDNLVFAEYDLAIGLVLWMVFTALVLKLVSKGCDRIVHHYCEPCEYEIKKRLAQKAFSMEYEMLDQKETLAAFRRVRAGEQGMGGVGRQLSEIYGFFQELAGIVIASGFMILLFTQLDNTNENIAVSLLMYAFMLFAFVTVSILSNYFAKKDGEFRVQTELENERVNTLSAYLLNLIAKESYIKDIRLFGLKTYLLKKMEWIRTVGKIYTKGGDYSGKCQAIPAFAVQMFAAITYFCIAVKALAGSITIGEVTMYAGAVITMVSGVQRLLAKYQDINYMNGYLSTYEEFITRPNMHYDGTLPIEKRDDNRYLLELSHVSFHYPGTTQNILKDVSMTFYIGEKLALVGLNGAGKTTLIKLLCRLYEPTEGEIRLNGINIAKYDYEEYVRIFSVVFQDFQLYHFPLEENVASGEEVDSQKLQCALKLAGMWERVQEMLQKEKTLLGHENGQGILLSGGEAQKIAIARALYKNAPFIILDEPAAALDPLAEAEIYENFNRLIQDKTAIYISHRMSSCRFCDRIIVLDGGQILEEGNHETLLKKQGRYYELYHTQAVYYTQ